MARRTTLVTPGKRSRGNKPFRRVGIFMLIVLMLAASAVAGLSYLGSSINNGGNNIGGEAGFSLGDDEELVDDLRILLKDEEMLSRFGNQKEQFLPVSEMGMMADLRAFLAGQVTGQEFNDPVSIPVAMEQSVIDARKASIASQKELRDVLAATLAEDINRLAVLPLADQRVEVLRLLKIKLRDPKYGDMFNQLLLSFPKFAEQNEWSVEFDNFIKGAMQREEDGEKPAGFWTCVRYVDADAQKAKDISKLVMSDVTDDKKGTFNYWRVYCHLVASLEDLFSFEGEQSLMSTANWHMSLNSDWANERTCLADYQEDKPSYILVHRDKMEDITLKIGVNLADSRAEKFEEVETPISTPKVVPEDPADPPVNPPAEVEPPTSTPDPDPNPDPEPKEYPATLIHYDKESGETLGTDNLGNFKVGTTVTGKAKTFTGYTADVASVSGVMVEGGLTLKIPYAPKHDGDGQKDPEVDPENKPGFDPGIGDNEPGDGLGDQEEEEPEGVDHENGATENPDDNQNNDGLDPTKPATPPITDDGQSDEWTDHDTGDVSDVDGDINNGIIVDEDGDDEQEVVVDASVVQEVPEEVTLVEEIAPEGAPVEEIAPEGTGEF